MASINELPADQVAVLRLLLAQGSSYGAIAGSLHIEEREVRRRAEAALDSLASVEAPSEPERSEVTDYLLGQQDASAQEKTRKLLASSPAAAAWARSLRTPLGELEGASLPVIPPTGPAPRVSEGDDGVAAGAGAAPASGGAGGQRRGGAVLLAAVAGVAILAVGLIIGRVTAPDSSGGGSSSGTPASQTDAKGTVVAAAQLKPPPGSPAPKGVGLAEFGRQQGQTILGVAAKGMPTPAKGSGYGVWLTGGTAKPVWLGYAQSFKGGQLAARSAVQVNPSAYRTMLVTLESTRSPNTPGKTYLSGAISTGG